MVQIVETLVTSEMKKGRDGAGPEMEQGGDGAGR